MKAGVSEPSTGVTFGLCNCLDVFEGSFLSSCEILMARDCPADALGGYFSLTNRSPTYT